MHSGSSINAPNVSLQASYFAETDATINIESGATATFSQMSTDYNGFNNPIVTINLDGALSLTNFNRAPRSTRPARRSRR